MMLIYFYNIVSETVPPPPPRDTDIPLKHDYIFIKEVDTPNGISYHGGGERCHTRLLELGEGGMEVTRY